jgi:hypothetical protein
METWRYARLLILEEPDLGGYTPNDRDIHRCCIMQDQGFGASYQATLVRGVRDSEILPWPARLHPNHDSSRTVSSRTGTYHSHLSDSVRPEILHEAATSVFAV